MIETIAQTCDGKKKEIMTWIWNTDNLFQIFQHPVYKKSGKSTPSIILENKNKISCVNYPNKTDLNIKAKKKGFFKKRKKR